MTTPGDPASRYDPVVVEPDTTPSEQPSDQTSVSPPSSDVRAREGTAVTADPARHHTSGRRRPGPPEAGSGADTSTTDATTRRRD